MSFRNKPCVYCGKKQGVKRERGHVIPRCMYPARDASIQRPTVPECSVCKVIWQDAENQFRNIVVLASQESNPAAEEQWHGSIHRSFTKPSGRRWFHDLYRRLHPVEVEGEPRHMVYPADDPAVLLVVRKIVRGLCHYHSLGTAISDKRVFADVLRSPIAPEFHDMFREFDLGKRFCQYYFARMADCADEFHSAWVIRFYNLCSFIGIVAPEAGFPQQRQATGGEAPRESV